MVQSMTGYGRSVHETDEYSVSVEIRTVNNRYLDINLRIPEALTAKESSFKSIIQRHLHRGQVTAKISLNGASDKWTHLQVNTELLNNYQRLFREIQDELGLEDSPELSDYISIPEVIEYQQDLPDEDVLASHVESALGDALEDVVAMRLREGESLRADMMTRIEFLSNALDHIANSADKNLELSKQSLENRIQSLLSEIPVDQERLAQEMAYMVDKIDITEETVRLESHIKQFLTLLDSDDTLGKKLNFLLQEMNREINTIGAKANNSEISHIVVDCKNEIEKLREQVQNVE